MDRAKRFMPVDCQDLMAKIAAYGGLEQPGSGKFLCLIVLLVWILQLSSQSNPGFFSFRWVLNHQGLGLSA